MARRLGRLLWAQAREGLWKRLRQATATNALDDLVAKRVRGQGDKFATSPATSLQVRGEVGAPKPVTGTAPKPAGSVAPAPTPSLPSTGASAAEGGDGWAGLLKPLRDKPLEGSPQQRAAGNDLLYRTLRGLDISPQEFEGSWGLVEILEELKLILD